MAKPGKRKAKPEPEEFTREGVETAVRINVARKSEAAKMVPQMKTTLIGIGGDKEEDRMVYRTVDGEEASLEVKLTLDSDGIIRIVHLHCMKDHGTTAWNQGLGGGREEFYELMHTFGQSSGFLMRCRKCQRVWNIMPGGADLGVLRGIGLKPSTTYRTEIVGVTVAVFTTTKNGWIPEGALLMIPTTKGANNLVLRMKDGAIVLQQS